MAYNEKNMESLYLEQQTEGKNMKQAVYKKVFSLLLSVILTLVTLTPVQIAAVSGQTDGSHKNLVVIVRFSDDSSSGYNSVYAYQPDYTYWQQFKSWFGETNIPYFDSGTVSLARYMRILSNGKWNLTSYFPQSSADYSDTVSSNAGRTVTGSSLTYITLPHDQNYYETSGDLQLISDAASIFNGHTGWTAGSADWGTNGVLDNLELVVQVSSEPDPSDELLWPHKSDASGAVSFGSMKVYEYNLVNSKAVGDLGTVKHEYLHTAGLGDLYRVGDTSGNAGPVGIWDIMGSAAGQWPLAQSLVDLGFEQPDDIKTIRGTGTHTFTLHAHYSTAGDGQAVKAYSPYSGDEYFVFEYRQKDADLLAPDHLVPSSGLIVYRVNQSVESDTNGHRTNRNRNGDSYADAIYVFRPDETGIHDSAGSLQNAALSTSSYAYLGNAANTRNTFGSSDMTKTIADGAIVDSSNRNSGLTVAITAQTDDSITFSISIPDYSSLSFWEQDGVSENAQQADCSSTAVDSDGILYQSYVEDSTSIQVRAWNGTGWKSLGAAATGNVGHAQLQCIGSQLYCTYSQFQTGNLCYCAAKWNGAAWISGASIPTDNSYANAPSSAVIDGALYALVDRDNTNLTLYKLNDRNETSSFTTVGDPLDVGYATEARLASLGSEPAVVCGDAGADFSSQTGSNLYILENGSWKKIYSETIHTARNLSAASMGDSLIFFAAFDSGTEPALYVVSGDSAHTVTRYPFSMAGTDIQDADLFISGGYAYLTTVNGGGLCTTWYAQTDAPDAWKQLGSVVMANTGTGRETVSSLKYGNKIYVSAINAAQTSVILLSHEQGDSISIQSLNEASAILTVHNSEAAEVCLAIYDRTGKMIKAWMRHTDAGGDSIELILGISKLPDGWIAKAFLLRQSDQSPMCPAARRTSTE